MNDWSAMRGKADAGEIELLREGDAKFGPFGVVFRNRFLFLRNDPVRFPDGSEGGYVSIHPAANVLSGAAILPIWDGKIVLAREFRHALRRWEIAIPRGFADEGEMGEEAARRELREEYGMEAGNLVFLGTMAPDSSIIAGVTSLYLAELDGIPRRVGEIHKSEPVVLSVGEVLEKMLAGEIVDPFLGFSLLCALRRSYLSMEGLQR